MLKRLDGLLPKKVWLPVAVYVTWDGGARPVARMAAGEAHAAIRGDEYVRLAALWHDLRTHTEPSRLLLAGRAGPQTRWDFSLLARFFRRYL